MKVNGLKRRFTECCLSEPSKCNVGRASTQESRKRDVTEERARISLNVTDALRNTHQCYFKGLRVLQIMDLKLCALLAIAETLGLDGFKSLGTAISVRTFQTFLILLTGQFIALKAYKTFAYPFIFSPLRHLPGPKVSSCVSPLHQRNLLWLTHTIAKDGNLLMGHAIKQFTAASPIDLYIEWSRRWPDADFIRYFDIGNQETLLINSLAALKEVFQTKCYSTVKPSLMARLVFEISGRGVLAAEGDEHKKQRRLLASMCAVEAYRST
jgi:hypothetical protein